MSNLPEIKINSINPEDISDIDPRTISFLTLIDGTILIVEQTAPVKKKIKSSLIMLWRNFIMTAIPKILSRSGLSCRSWKELCRHLSWVSTVWRYFRITDWLSSLWYCLRRPRLRTARILWQSFLKWLRNWRRDLSLCAERHPRSNLQRHSP
mgnify:CR=1 FL=1